MDKANAEGKSITRAYWAKVWKEIKEVVKNDADAKGHFTYFVWIFILSTALAVLFLTGTISIAVFESTLGNLGLEVLVAGGPFFVTLLLLLRDAVRVPAKLHEELGGFLGNPFRIEVYKPERQAKRGENKWVSLQVNNTFPHKQVNRCHVRLDDIFDLRAQKSIIQDQQNLAWSAREHNNVQSGDQPLDISAGDFGVCDVAKAEVDKNNAHYLTWFGKEYIEPGEYVLSFTVFGNWDGFSSRYPYHATLRFERTNELFLSDVREGKYGADDPEGARRPF